jgi:hypothetical protein
VALFVNMSNNWYENPIEWRSERCEIVWWAQARQTADSAIIHAIIHGATAEHGSKRTYSSDVERIVSDVHALYADGRAASRTGDEANSSPWTPAHCTDVVLFARHPDEPYVMLGRVQLVSAEFSAAPMKFTFQLVDVESRKAVESWCPAARVMVGATVGGANKGKP